MPSKLEFSRSVRLCRLQGADSRPGGSAFLIVELYKEIVTGINLSESMLELARVRLARHQRGDKVNLIHKDCQLLTETGSYDAIQSRDISLHIENKGRLFVELHRALKKTEHLLFTDCAFGPGPWHVAARVYHLHTVDEYADIVRQAGFHSVAVEDSTELFIELLPADIRTIDRLDISGDVKQSWNPRWQSKLERARGGDHLWITVSSRASA